MIGLADVLDDRVAAAATRAQSIAAELRAPGAGSVAVHVRLDEALDDLDRYSRLSAQLRATATMTDAYGSGRASLVGDLIDARTNPEASNRLVQLRAQHHLESRDIGLGVFSSGMPPSLLAAIAPGARAGRPFLEAIGSRPLPPIGSTLTPLRVSTVVVAGATLEGTGPTDVNPTVASGTAIPVVLVSARTRCSRTLFQRGGTAALELGVLAELVAAVENECDRLALVGTGTAPQPFGLLNTAGISSTAIATATTGQDLLTKVAAAATASSAVSRQAAELVVMHSRRSAWYGSRSDGMLDPSFAAGRMLGSLLDVVIDDNVPSNLGVGTNEDRVIVLRRAGVAYYESALEVGVLEQTAPTSPGQVDVVVFRFMSVDTTRRAGAIGVLTGAGLAAVAA